MGRRLIRFCLAGSLILTGCARMSGGSIDDTTKGTTGYFNEQGIPYISQDARMDEEVAKAGGAAAQPKPEPGTKVGAKPAEKPFRTLLKEFEISRYGKDDKTPSRFGKDHYVIKFFLENGQEVDFQGQFTTGLSIQASSGDYTLKGSLKDNDPSETLGDFELSNKKESAKILYRAYKAKLTVRQDADKPIAQDSSVDRQLRSLREDTFGWVNNWAVVQGRAFYLVDIVKSNNSSTPLVAPVFAFKGESLRTGGQEHPAATLNPDFAKDVKLVGNAETEGLRVFSAELEDNQAKDKYEFMLDVEEQKQDGRVPSEDDANIDTVTPEQPGVTTTPEQPQQPETTTSNDPQPEQPAATQPDQPVVTTTDQPADTSTTSAEPQVKTPEQPEITTPEIPKAPEKPIAKTPEKPVVKAPEKPVVISKEPPKQKPAPVIPKPKPQPPPKPDAKPVVKKPTSSSPIGVSYLHVNTTNARTGKMVRDYARNRNLPGVQRWITKFRTDRRLSNFFFYAYPLRGLIEAIGERFDVAPTYAYLTVIESSYLTGGHYDSRQIGDGGEAWGPFQMHPPAASESGVKVTHRQDDERFYFAPAACGAANYMIALVNQFPVDATVAIMGYNQGAGGARSRARRFGYDFHKLALSHTLEDAVQAYVERKLAIFFIASDMRKYGFDPARYINAKWPSRSTIMPPAPIHNPQCRAVVQSVI